MTVPVVVLIKAAPKNANEENVLIVLPEIVRMTDPAAVKVCVVVPVGAAPEVTKERATIPAESAVTSKTSSADIVADELSP